jgi:hypothetical protein
MPNDCYKDQREMCKESWTLADKNILARIDGMDKALELKSKNHIAITAFIVTLVQIVIQGIFLLIWYLNK